MGETPDWVRADKRCDSSGEDELTGTRATAGEADTYARRADGEEPSPSADTAASETAMTVASDTVLAWSDDDDADEPVRASWRVVCGRAAAVLAGSLMAAGLVVLSWRELPEQTPENAPPVAVTATQARAVAPATEPAPPLPATTGSVAQKITPPPLPAPDPDTEFLAAMDRAQVHMATEPEAINQGHQVCRSLDKGASIQGITAQILSVSPGISEPQVRSVVYAAVDAYCPQFENRGEHR
ncbi:DUF732 domain-containing protein [Mycobacterium intracellulare]|uniref:DUF732 domain-containing protein n=1 Tax=Mycobacterium intracellulare TaxID=1767 RepID=UPI0034D5E4AB